jgi:hypothetical protein
VEVVPVKRAVIPIAAAVVGVALACGPTTVQGSLSEILDLTYHDIKLGFAGDEIALRYTRPRGTGEDTVLEVSEKLDGLLVRTGDYVNLAEPLPAFALADAGVPDGGLLPDGGLFDEQRGLVTRDVFNDPRKTFPLISDGFMVLYDVPRDGGTVKGSFSVTFQRCVDFGCGRTVFGDFKAKVQ